MKTIIQTAANGDVTTVIDMGENVPDPVFARQTVIIDTRDEKGVIVAAVNGQAFVGKKFDQVTKEISAPDPLPVELLAEIQQIDAAAEEK